MDFNQDNTRYSLYIGELLFKLDNRLPLTEKEQSDLDAWRQSSPDRMAIFEEGRDRRAMANELRLLNDQYDTDRETADLFAALGIENRDPQKKAHRISLIPLVRRRLTIAASLIVLFSCVWLFLKNHRGPGLGPSLSEKYKNDIPRQGKKAILTLADGTRIVLDSSSNGQLARQGSAAVIKGNGLIAYSGAKDGKATGSGEDKDELVVYNTMTTPVGGQYQLILPDGSRVWLNAASSLKYPTAFTGRQRRVELTGEAYFEIAKNKSLPFYVGSGGTEIEVLGTHFNVHAYEDEAAVKTTLLEGGVRIREGQQTRILQPGEQAQSGLSGNGPALPITVATVDAGESIAWKNGLFSFQNQTIGPVMKELSRWYNIAIVFKGAAINDHFYATLPRSMTLDEVLKRLEMTGCVRFSLENDKLIVTKP